MVEHVAFMATMNIDTAGGVQSNITVKHCMTFGFKVWVYDPSMHDACVGKLWLLAFIPKPWLLALEKSNVNDQYTGTKVCRTKGTAGISLVKYVIGNIWEKCPHGWLGLFVRDQDIQTCAVPRTASKRTPYVVVVGVCTLHVRSLHLRT